jgi:hypothetical protein
MAAPDTLIIIHYHLLPGGVCSSIKQSLVALAQSGWFSDRSLRVLVGRTDAVEEFILFLEQHSVQVEIEVDPRLDYTDRVWSDHARETCLYWAHNPTLGKNPLLTAGLLAAGQKAASSGASHRFLYHIHDFAECGRLQNLLYLRRCWGSGGLEDLFPTSNNCCYAVLSSADLHRLARAGVPEERIFHLPNAIPAVKAEQKTARKDMAKGLQVYASEYGYRFEPDRPWWTLPIRLIRRKNVLEALLIAATADDSPQLLVTLDANSDPERPYAEAVKDLFRVKKHAAVVGFGHQLVGTAFSFDDLLLASDTVVTTSVLEGFGFAFLEGANRGRPLLGRNLEEVTTDFVEAGFPASSLYGEMFVPVNSETRAQMAARGREFAQEQGSLLGVSQVSIDGFIAALGTLFADDAVDFGFLDLKQQLEVTSRLRDRAFVEDLRSLNPEAARPAPFPADFSIRLDHHFGLQAHGSRLAATFEALFAQGIEGGVTGNLSSSLLDLYFMPKFHRPLMGKW